MKVHMVRVRIWDLPTRLFHWGLVLSVTGLIITGNVGGNAMVWHFRLGYCVLTLLFFRVLWGFFGGHWSRWSQLPISPKRVWAYLQGHSESTPSIGHNPLGSWSVLAFLLILTLQVSTGLISDDEIANLGPLSSLVSGQWVAWATSWHKGWGKTILIILVNIHLMALVWYRWQKSQSLVPAMWHGDKSLPYLVTSSIDDLRSRALALVLLIVAAMAVVAIVSLGN
jgi:cytochrome b